MAAWFQQIDEAQTVAAVVGAARDYLATWSPEELARLPRSCRPQRPLRDAADLEELNASAVDEYRTTRASGDALTALQVYTGFLLRACLRIARLRDSAPGREVDDAASVDADERRKPGSRLR